MATERIKRALELARAQREGRNASVAPLLSKLAAEGKTFNG